MRSAPAWRVIRSRDGYRFPVMRCITVCVHKDGAAVFRSSHTLDADREYAQDSEMRWVQVTLMLMLLVTLRFSDRLCADISRNK
jgi:hypothetical protein